MTGSGRRRARGPRLFPAAIAVAIVVGGIAHASPAFAANCSSPATANDDDYTTAFGVPVTITAPGLLSNDTGNTLRVQVSWGPEGLNPDPSDDVSFDGNATIDYGTSPSSPNRFGGFTYTPDTDPTNPFTGIDTFDYWITDACGNEDTATANITVVPTVNNTAYTTPYNTVLSVPVGQGFLATDKGVDPMSIIYDATSAHGGDVADNNESDGSFEYTPPHNFSGIDSFGFTVDDINGDITYDATVHIIVGPGPTAPTSVSATGGNGQATIGFGASAGNGSPVTSYTVTATPGGATATGPASPLTVTGLSNGTPYTFTVHASNARGDGPESATSSSVTPQAVPGPPTGVNATAGNGAAIVKWKTPSTIGGAPIDSYIVTPYLNGIAQATQPFASTATTETVTRLANAQHYTFTVAANSATGLGTSSIPSAAIVVGTPLAPGRLSAAPGNGRATLHWAAPANNGAPITAYVVTPYLKDVAKPAHVFNSAATTEVVTGLANAMGYTFRVVAKNARGTGPPSAMGGAVRVGTPGPPFGVVATAGTASATVKWSAPANNGATIISYIVTPYLNRVAQPGKLLAATATTVKITGLKRGKAYTFRVSAHNVRGTGPPSYPSKAVTTT